MAPHSTADHDSTLSNNPLPPEARHGSVPNPSLPYPDPCLSFWHRTTRGFLHLNANHDKSVPEKAKYVIIGSGISGSLTAFELLEAGVPGNDVLILEAREAVSGASGRNAGHVRPDAFRGFTAYASIHGPDQARNIIENERIVLERVNNFVQKHNVPCDFHYTKTFDVCLTQEFADYQAKSLEAYKTAGGDVSHVKYHEGKEAKEKTRIANALAAYEWPAGSSHPAKLAQWILDEVVSKGVGLWTHCPATEISRHESTDNSAHARWDVRTPRGVVSTENVVHCTNAYAAYLLPGLKDFVTPNRAQAHSFVPGAEFSGAGAIEHTMSLRYNLRHFFSLIQRQGDGTMIFGVSRTNPEWDEKTLGGIVTFDDRGYDNVIEDTCRKEFAKLLSGPTAKSSRHGEGLDHAWTGIIAMTPDSVPMVGAVDGLEGQWICAGFNGHGMARIFTCAPGLVKLITGKAWAETGLPECFEYSKRRLLMSAKDSGKSVW